MVQNQNKIHEALTLFIALVFFTVPLPFAFGQDVDVVPPEFRDLVPQEIKDQIQLLSGNSMLIAAKALGVDKVMEKELEVGGSPPGNANTTLQLLDFPHHA